jgi:UDP-glucose 4-epimerase
VPIFIHQLLDGNAATIHGDGGQTRDLIFVGDVVRANLAAAEHPQAAGAVFNVCTGRATRVIDLLAALTELIPGALPPVFVGKRAGDIYESVGDPARCGAVLGFRAGTSLAQGLKASVESWR